MPSDPPSLLVRGGAVVTSSGQYRADVLVRGGRIVAVGRELSDSAAQVVDARDCWILPGGVDAHTHLDFAPGRFRTCDDFHSGTVAALLGGTTSLLDFALPCVGQSVDDAVAERIRVIEAAQPVADVGLHAILHTYDSDSLRTELRGCLDRGVCDFKIYLAHRGEVMVDEDVAYHLLRSIAEVGALAMIHAENGYLIDARRNVLAQSGNIGPLNHALSRPMETELDAVNRAIMLAKMSGASTYLVHLSTAAAVEAVAAARLAGVDVTAETCPQYLVLTDDVLAGPLGWQYLFSPPPRTAIDQDALWNGLSTGAVATVASDHSPYRMRDKSPSTGPHADFRTVPNGIPGVQERLPLLYEFGVRRGKISISQLVQSFATNPAELFALDDRGEIRVGAQADLVVFDPTQRGVIDVGTAASRCDFNAYQGIEVGGRIDSVIKGGLPVVRHGELVVEAATGRYLSRRRIT